MKWTIQGILKYSPKMLGDRKSDRWWLIAAVHDDAIGKYYRHLFHIGNYKCEKIMRPAWKEHITLVRNEEPVKKEKWEAYADQKIEFLCISGIKTNGEYFWLDVESEQVSDIREELGLSRIPSIPLHLSIGHNVP